MNDLLYEKPEGWQTILEKGEFPMWVSETEKYVDDGKFFGRYRKGRVQL